ncbi:lactonase family protein [Nocardia nova]|uniref:lactonase family protein n=1 Tax=Nocardia nova TaxID=37330 RepID=UPI0009EDAFDF|nr:beta-propeller fold lactonase family protein [Nocardia nova]
MTNWHLYIGCFTEDLWLHFPRPESDTTISSRGIEHLIFDDDTGALRDVGLASDNLASPQYLALHPRLPVLYAAEFSRPGKLVTFEICADGRLKRRTAQNSLGTLAVATSVHPSGAAVYVGHLGDGVLTSCTLDAEGGILDMKVAVPGAAGARIDKGERFNYRGAGPKHHQVRITADGRALVVTDVASDAVVSYAVDPRDGSIGEVISRVHFPEGAAPRHIEFHPRGNIAYVVGEGDATLYVLEARRGVPLRILSSCVLAPPSGEKDKCLPSELHLHPDRRTLFVGLRRADRIAVLDVDATGRVKLLHYEACGGRDPRAVRASPTGRHLFVGNWASNNVAVFSVDDKRRLKPVGQPVEVPSPSSFVFVPE